MPRDTNNATCSPSTLLSSRPDTSNGDPSQPGITPASPNESQLHTTSPSEPAEHHHEPVACPTARSTPATNRRPPHHYRWGVHSLLARSLPAEPRDASPAPPPTLNTHDVGINGRQLSAQTDEHRIVSCGQTLHHARRTPAASGPSSSEANPSESATTSPASSSATQRPRNRSTRSASRPRPLPLTTTRLRRAAAQRRVARPGPAATRRTPTTRDSLRHARPSRHRAAPRHLGEGRHTCAPPIARGRGQHQRPPTRSL